MLDRTQLIDRRIERLYEILKACELCARKCRVDRNAGGKGVCRSGAQMMVSSYGAHFGEESELVGRHGSGTIFLAGCNLLCLYCQNYEISHLGTGSQMTPHALSRVILEVQRAGCHNINFVTPSHFTPQIIESLRYAIEEGLSIPVIWNCGGYENVQVIRLLDGIVDIYMPDIKYGDAEPAKKYSSAPDYFERCTESVIEMYRQVGDLQIDPEGIARKGILFRHLVLPNRLAGSEKVLKFIAGISKNSYVNIMGQYRPCGKAGRYREINRRPTENELEEVMQMAHSAGLYRGFPGR